MKRVLICAVAVAALAIPVQSLAQVARGTYTGEFEGIPGSSVKLKTFTEGVDTNVVSFFVRDVPVDCEGGISAMVTKAGIRGEIPVGQRKRFRAVDKDEDSTFRVVGRAGNRKASGHFRYFGELNVEGTPLECDTGPLEWNARAG